MIACLGIYGWTGLLCDRCGWSESCPPNVTACSGPVVYTDTTQGEYKAVESEEVHEPKVIPAYLPYPAQRIVMDRRKFILITAPRRLQRGRNWGR